MKPETLITYFVMIMFFIVGAAIGLTICTSLIWVLFNYCLPVFGLEYPLTLGQSFLGAIGLVIVKTLVFRGK